MRTRPAAAQGAATAGRAADPHRAGDDAARSAVGFTPVTKAAMAAGGDGARGGWGEGKEKKIGATQGYAKKHQARRVHTVGGFVANQLGAAAVKAAGRGKERHVGG